MSADLDRDLFATGSPVGGDDGAAATIALPLVAAVSELRWVGRTWAVVGPLGLAATLALGSVGQLSPLEVSGMSLVFGLTVSGALAGILLGRRSGPASLYAQIFDRAPAPPARARVDGASQIAGRALAAALGLVVAMAIAAAVAVVAALVLIGKPRDEVLTHLPAAAGLVAAGWTTVCGACALQAAAWIARWEHRKGKLVLCRALLSGTLRPVYYVADVPSPGCTEAR